MMPTSLRSFITITSVPIRSSIKTGSSTSLSMAMDGSANSRHSSEIAARSTSSSINRDLLIAGLRLEARAQARGVVLHLRARAFRNDLVEGVERLFVLAPPGLDRSAHQ